MLLHYKVHRDRDLVGLAAQAVVAHPRIRDRAIGPKVRHVEFAARGLSLVTSDPAAARLDLDHALQLNPRHARAHYALAVLLRTSSPREALIHADAALAAEPDLLDAVQLRAVVRARLGDSAALSDAERLCQVPTSYHLYNAACALALLAEATHDPRLAQRALQCLDRACDAGFPPGRAAADADLKGLHNLKDYPRVIDRPATPSLPAR